MKATADLRADAIAIWKAGVAAVDSFRLVREAVACDDRAIEIAGESVPLERARRIVVVGAGKAGAGMAAGFEAAIPPHLKPRLSGWINVPADCVRPLERIHLHAARPAAVNEPTDAGVEGARRILEMVRSLAPDDLCVVLLSGGGSALLPAPADGITLDDKQQLTRGLMHAGATIQELNTVRKRLSQIKGGRLAAACRAGMLVTLVISDVIGDPLDIIASGPTVPDTATPADAWRVLERFQQAGHRFPERAATALKNAAERTPTLLVPACHVVNRIIGNNAVAVRAAEQEALRRGYAVQSLGSDLAGEAHAVGRRLARACAEIERGTAVLRAPACLLSGGEPVVRLAQTDRPRKGGRNQEVALAAIDEWNGRAPSPQVVILSGGTDGEDGPTDAAGAIADALVATSARQQGLETSAFLAINNSYEFFDRTGGLLKTGPTHTNVMDLRVALVGGDESSDALRMSPSS